MVFLTLRDRLCVVSGLPSASEFKVNQNTICRFRRDTGSGFCSFTNRFEFEDLHNRAHDQPDFQQPKKSSRTESRSVSEPEMKHVPGGNPFLG